MKLTNFFYRSKAFNEKFKCFIETAPKELFNFLLQSYPSVLLTNSANFLCSFCEILSIEMVFKCQTDSFLKEFETKVTKVEKTDDGKVLVSFEVGP